MIVLTFTDRDDHRIAAHMDNQKFRMLLLDPEKCRGLAQEIASVQDWVPEELEDFVDQKG